MGTIDFGDQPNTEPTKGNADMMRGKNTHPTPGRRSLQKDKIDWSEER